MAVHVLARLLPVAALAAASLFFAEVTAPAGVVAQGTTTGSNATDPCAALAASNSYTKGDSPTPSVVSGADLFACYNSFSVPAAAKKAQIDGVKAYFEFYPYLDLIASSSSPLYASNLDLFAALDAIAADNTVTTEFALHSAIADVVSSLNDAHSYYASLCFASGRMMQPYILDAKYKVGSPPTIYIRNTIVNGSTLWQQTGGTPSTANILAGLQKAVATFFDQAVPDYTKYVGYTVSKINGIDAVTYIQQHADKRTGVSHSAETRFNSMMPRSVYNPSSLQFSVVDGLIYRARVVPSWLPLQMTYDLVSPTGTPLKVSNVPWAVYVSTGQSWSTQEQYYRANCASKGATGRAKAARNAHFVQDQQREEFTAEDDEFPYLQTMAPNFVFNETVAVELQASHAITVASHLKAAASSKSFGEAAFSISSPLVSDGTSAFYQLDADTGVWALTALKPESTTNAAITSMMATAAGGLKALETAGVSKLIIDTTGNDGGLICAGVAMLQMLFPSATPLPFDVRLSKAMAAFVQYADSTPALRQQGTVFSTSDLVSQNSRSSNILSAVRAIARGGKTSSYSDRFDLSCAVFANPFAPASLPKLSKGWSPDAISLVSDGRCGSMCAEMTRVLRDQFGIRAYVVGESSGAAFQPSSFEGGSVASFEKIAADAAAIVASANTAAAAFAGVAVPAALPLSATGSLPVWESYSPRGKIPDAPVEWVPQPAEALLPVEDITDRAAVWKAAAAAMGKVENKGRSQSSASSALIPRGIGCGAHRLVMAVLSAILAVTMSGWAH